jgi:hypothetical protein
VDEVVKVEVEGVAFNVWVVEERGRCRTGVVLGEGVEEVVSEVVPSEGSGAVEEGYGGGSDNSGEDERSVEEGDGDVGIQIQHGVRLEDKPDTPKGDQVAKGYNCLLTCGKSTNDASSHKEIPPVATTFVCEEMVTGHVEEVPGLVVSRKVGGPEASGERLVDVDVLVGQTHVEDVVGTDQAIEEVDQIGAGSDPTPLGLVDARPDPVPLGLFEESIVGVGPCQGEGDLRLSSVSEPEDVFHSHKSKRRGPPSKHRKQLLNSKFHQLGIPKCLQLVEAVKEGGIKSRRRRNKGGGNSELVVGEKGMGEGEIEDGVARGNEELGVVGDEMLQPHDTSKTCSPSSGINLFLEGDSSAVPETQLGVSEVQPIEDDRAKVVEAAKLLRIQKEVGFTFYVEDGEIVKELVQQEVCDQAKKMDWEEKNGYQ